MRDEWVEAVNRLLLDIDTWLDEADTEGILDRLDAPLERAEVGLGRYTVQGLRISVGDLAVEVVPIARNVVGSPRLGGVGAKLAGRVDIGDGIKKSIVRRVLSDHEEFWEVSDERFGATRLDRAKLEEILQDLLA